MIPTGTFILQPYSIFGYVIAYTIWAEAVLTLALIYKLTKPKPMFVFQPPYKRGLTLLRSGLSSWLVGKNIGGIFRRMFE